MLKGIFNTVYWLKLVNTRARATHPPHLHKLLACLDAAPCRVPHNGFAGEILLTCLLHRAVSREDKAHRLPLCVPLSLQVVDTSSGSMRLAATMRIPSLQSSSSSSSNSSTSSSSSTWLPGYAAMPIVKLWRDGSRAAIGNARQQAVWVVDLQGAAASVELSGEQASSYTVSGR
jgi:hypothetical protein